MKNLLSVTRKLFSIRLKRNDNIQKEDVRKSTWDRVYCHTTFLPTLIFTNDMSIQTLLLIIIIIITINLFVLHIKHLSFHIRE